MFSGSSDTCPNPFSSQQINDNQNNQVYERSLNIKMSHARESREHKRSRMRQINQMQLLQYQNVGFSKFMGVVEKQNNPYTLLVTIFVIADNFEWRQYVCHLEILIKKFTNMVQSSRGKVLEELNNSQRSREILNGYSFQQRLQTMLHLSNKQFQQHLLILIHALIAYNKRYCLIDEAQLSDHLTYRHAYEKSIRTDVIWLLTRMSMNPDSIAKVMKSYLSNYQTTPLLAVLTMIANFIYEEPPHIIQNFIVNSEFQIILQNGLLSNHYETSRQAVFVCNNLLFKSKICCNFIVNNPNVCSQIQKQQNEEVAVFYTALNSINSMNNKQVNPAHLMMEEEHTS